MNPRPSLQAPGEDLTLTLKLLGRQHKPGPTHAKRCLRTGCMLTARAADTTRKGGNTRLPAGAGVTT